MTQAEATMTTDYDWTAFSKTVFIAAAREDVFRAWATPGGIVRWFIAEAAYSAPDGTRRGEDEIVAAGDAYHWQWHQPVSIAGEVLAVAPNTEFVFTFGEQEAGSGLWHRVTVRFSDVEDGVTRVDLIQDNMLDTPDSHVQWYLSCNLGWSFFMTNLKALLEHGVDLRETELDRAIAARAISVH